MNQGSREPHNLISNHMFTASSIQPLGSQEISAENDLHDTIDKPEKLKKSGKCWFYLHLHICKFKKPSVLLTTFFNTGKAFLLSIIMIQPHYDKQLDNTSCRFCT